MKVKIEQKDKDLKYRHYSDPIVCFGHLVFTRLLKIFPMMQTFMME